MRLIKNNNEAPTVFVSTFSEYSLRNTHERTVYCICLPNHQPEKVDDVWTCTERLCKVSGLFWSVCDCYELAILRNVT